MLKSLRKLDSKKAQNVLSSLVGVLSPSPEPFRKESISELQRQVIKEALHRLKLSPDINDYPTHSKLIGLFSDELSELVLGNANESNKIKQRLGQEGNLRTDLYKIEFRDTFKEIEKTGIRKNHIEDLIKYPDQTQHLFTEKMDVKQTISLFMKSHNLDQKNWHYLLCETQRKKDTLSVSWAWRFYVSDIDVTKAKMPLDYLWLFIEKYGIAFKVGSSSPRKFFFYEEIPIDKTTKTAQLFTLPELKKPFTTSFLLRQKGELIEVLLAYAIDMEKYLQDMKYHGVFVS